MYGTPWLPLAGSLPELPALTPTGRTREALLDLMADAYRRTTDADIAREVVVPGDNPPGAGGSGDGRGVCGEGRRHGDTGRPETTNCGIAWTG